MLAKVLIILGGLGIILWLKLLFKFRFNLFILESLFTLILFLFDEGEYIKFNKCVLFIVFMLFCSLLTSNSFLLLFILFILSFLNNSCFISFSLFLNKFWLFWIAKLDFIILLSFFISVKFNWLLFTLFLNFLWTYVFIWVFLFVNKGLLYHFLLFTKLFL